MSNKIDTGGFADYMSLRDYFAAKAMAAIIVGNKVVISTERRRIVLAQDSYRVADAMLIERARKKE